jgi:hypothetical protein
MQRSNVAVQYAILHETIIVGVKNQWEFVAVVTGAVVWVVVAFAAGVVGGGVPDAAVVTDIGVAVARLTEISTMPFGSVVTPRLIRALFL